MKNDDNKLINLCKGAGFYCLSGRHCNVFDCLVIRKSYAGCVDWNLG